MYHQVSGHTGPFCQPAIQPASQPVRHSLRNFQTLSPSAMPVPLDGARTTLATMAADAIRDPGFKACSIIELQFCGVRMRVPSADPSTEVSLRLEACLRDLSIGFDGGLTPMAHERWLFEGRAGAQVIVTADMLPECDGGSPAVQLGVRPLAQHFAVPDDRHGEREEGTVVAEDQPLSGHSRPCSCGAMPRPR